MEVIHSGKALGGEVRGFDLSEPWTEERAAFVRKAWGDCLVLLFRNQSIEDEHLLAMAEAGYAYAVVGDAGAAARFYASVVKVQSIAGSTPGIYADPLNLPGNENV